VKPVLQALVLAERIYQDISGKKIIAGTFHGIVIRRGPPIKEETDDEGTVVRRTIRGGTDGGSPYAYVSLTDVCDNTQLCLQFVNLTKNEVMFKQDITVRCADRLQTVEIVAALPTLRVPEAGTYAFEIVCEEEIIGSHRLIAKEAAN
jgi:Family of unknown function (DUF6941)